MAKNSIQDYKTIYLFINECVLQWYRGIVQAKGVATSVNGPLTEIIWQTIDMFASGIWFRSSAN